MGPAAGVQGFAGRETFSTGVVGYTESEFGYGVRGDAMDSEFGFAGLFQARYAGVMVNSSSAGVVAYGGVQGVYGVGSYSGVTGQKPYAQDVRTAVPSDAEGAVMGLAAYGTGVYAYSGGDYALRVRSESGVFGYVYCARFEKGTVDIDENLNVAKTIHTSALFCPFKLFQIDHPLAPTEKFLNHACVESDERKNLYDGIVSLDEKGEAVVQLPAWFEAVNCDFRYSLTCIGAFAPIYISAEIADGRFGIAGGQAGQKVSWQVTGVRHDPLARANPMVVEEQKPAHERGLYLYPQPYGQPETMTFRARWEAEYKRRLADHPKGFDIPQPPDAPKVRKPSPPRNG